MREGFKTSFKISNKLETLYTGGKVVFSQGILFSVVNEDINLIDVKTGESSRICCESDLITSFAVSRDSKLLATAGRSNLITLWSIPDKIKIRTWKAHSSAIISMEFDSTSNLLSLASANGEIKNFDVKRGYCTHSFRGHTGLVTCLAFNPYSKTQLASGSADNTIRLWDLNTNKQKILSEHKGHVVNVLYSKFLISTGRDNLIVVWDWNKFCKIHVIPSVDSLNGSCILPQNLTYGLENSTYGLANSSYGLANSSLDPTQQSVILLTSGAKGTVKFWDVTFKRLVREVELDFPALSLSLSFCENFLVAIDKENDISILDLNDNLSLAYKLSASPTECLSVSLLSENALALATSSNSLRIYDTNTKNCKVLLGHEAIIMCVRSTNIPKPLLATGSRDSTAIVWEYSLNDPLNATFIAKCKGHTDTINALAWASSPYLLLTGSSDKTVKVWSLDSNFSKCLYTIIAHDKEVQSIHVAPNNKIFATGSLDKLAKIWSISGELLGTLRGHTRGIWCVKFSPIDKILATGSTDKTIKLWNLSDFTCTMTLSGHMNSVTDLFFMNFSTQILSCGLDGLVKIWNLLNSTCQKTLSDNEDRIWALDMRENKFATGASNGTVLLWEDSTKEEQEKIATQNEELILLEQDLSNILHKKDYLSSIKLLLKLKHPAKLLHVVQEMLSNGDISNNTSGNISTTPTESDALLSLISTLNEQELSELISACVSWNTNWRYAHVAQEVMNRIILCNRVRDTANKSVLSAFRAYSMFHYKSIDGLSMELKLLDNIIETITGII